MSLESVVGIGHMAIGDEHERMLPVGGAVFTQRQYVRAPAA
jgi:hypothetical protein